MADFLFLAVPNIDGMRVLRYIKVIGIVFVFGLCLFFLVFFLVNYYKSKRLIQQLKYFSHETQFLEQQLFIQKIVASSGKQKLVLFIEYLERFATNNFVANQLKYKYANVFELLLYHGFTASEIELCKQTLYANKELPFIVSKKIDTYFIHYYL